MSQDAPAPSKSRKVAREAVLGAVIGAALWVTWNAFTDVPLATSMVFLCSAWLAFFFGTMAVFGLRWRPNLPRLSRFRSFSLLTLMALVGVCGVLSSWFVGEWRLVEQRRAMLKQLGVPDNFVSHSHDDRIKPLPWINRAMGDKLVPHLMFDDRNDPRIRSVDRLFPESTILAKTSNGGTVSLRGPRTTSPEPAANSYCRYLRIEPPFILPADMPKEGWSLTILDNGAVELECQDLRGDRNIILGVCHLPVGTFDLPNEVARLRGEIGPAASALQFDSYFVSIHYSDDRNPSYPLVARAPVAEELFQRARQMAVGEGVWKTELEEAWKRSPPF